MAVEAEKINFAWEILPSGTFWSSQLPRCPACCSGHLLCLIKLFTETDYLQVKNLLKLTQDLWQDTGIGMHFFK